MTPLDFLREELRNVGRALAETLRYDYGPEQGREYYNECHNRLTEIETAVKGVSPDDVLTIRTRLGELLQLASWILLIERSHLGEFSWPFSDELKRIAKTLLAEKNLKGELVEPLIHVVAEGEGYQIVYESQVPSASSGRPFVVVAFQRSLKHHALLHSIFGHELGHSALGTTATGTVLNNDVLGAMTAAGPMADEASFNAWLNDPGAPQYVQTTLAGYAQNYGTAFVLTDDDRQNWLSELLCDLFGLLLFGPSFMAAHRTLLQPDAPEPYKIHLVESTHPPYALRHKMLVSAMRILGWHTPVTVTKSDRFYRAELAMLDYLMEDPYDTWAAIFDDNQLRGAIAGLQKVFARLGSLSYTRIDPNVLVALMDRLARHLPPIRTDISEDGSPQLTEVAISQTLYAGWAYWFGRTELSPGAELPFFETNRLCDLALLQQRAIDEAIRAGIP